MLSVAAMPLALIRARGERRHTLRRYSSVFSCFDDALLRRHE